MAEMQEAFLAWLATVRPVTVLSRSRCAACLFQVDSQEKPEGFLKDVVKHLVEVDVFTPSGLVHVDGQQLNGLTIGKRGFIVAASIKARKEFAAEEVRVFFFAISQLPM